MVSPSILVDTRTGWRWTGQYTYDNVWRVPDRGPVYDQLPAGVSIRKGFAAPGDYVEDRLRVLRSDLSYDFNNRWSLRWVASKREDRKSTRLNSSHLVISYAVFCLKKKTRHTRRTQSRADTSYP